MRKKNALAILFFLALGLVSIGLARRIALHYQHGGNLRVELGRLRLTTLTPETQARLDSLSSKVLVTYYVSRPDRMPSSMRRMERQVTDLLEAMRAHAPERFNFSIVDPDSKADLSGFAARRRISPYRVREVAHDSWAERTVWSSMSIAYGAFPDAILHGIGPDHLPRLQATLVSWLNQLERPRAARIVLAAPPGFQELETALGERGRVARIALDEGAAVPEADLLVWIRPRNVTEEQRRGLDRLLEAGGSVLIAGGLYIADDRSLVEVGGEPALALRRSGFPAAELLAHFGLIAQPELVLDGRNDSLSFGGEERAAPFLIRCIAPNQDFRGWAGQPNGSLLFAAPTAFGLDTARQRELGYTAQALATSSDMTWIQEAPLAPRPPLLLSRMSPEIGIGVAKQPLIVGLRHDDDWRGRMIVCGADSPFADGLYSREHVAHRRLLRVLLDETIGDLRLVVAGADVARAQPIPPLSGPGRLFWRTVCVALLPLLLAGFALTRGVSREAIARSGSLRPALKFAGALFGLLVVVRVAAASGFSIDATTDNRNELSVEARAIAKRAGERGEVRVELLFSETDKLPPELRPWIGKLERRIEDFRRAGARLHTERLRPEDLEDSDLQRLRDEGLVRHQGATRADEVTTFRRYYSTLRFSRDDRSVLIPLPDSDAFELLEFHLAFALWRLEGNAAPHVVFATDAPRLSAAEDYQDFQQKGLFAPKGSDVYRVARERIARNGLRISYVNPRDPKMPENVDCLVWLQPRRSIERMAESALRYLVGGGNFILAAQHFNMLQQQFRGDKTSGFRPRYWPQPQTPDIERVYFPELSIELVREVLFDELSLTIDTLSEVVGRGAGRIYERQEVSLPFQIRASSKNFHPTSPLMQDLGDQAFVWANYLRFDEELLDELGIRATILMSTSARTCSYLWSGGFVPEEYLGIESPTSTQPTEPVEYLGRLPLGVLFEGPFPKPEKGLDYRLGEMTDEDREAELPWPNSRPGRLVLLGCSEFLKNDRILDEEFRGDHLLWNLVAHLALPEELAALATRRSIAPGFGFLTPEQKLTWRSIVVGGPVAAIALFFVLLMAWRRRLPVLRPPISKRATA